MNEVITKWVEASPAYHKIPKYGVHGCDISFYLKGPKGAVQFVVSTGWMLPETYAWWEETGKAQELRVPSGKFLASPFPSDLGYHSPVPQYEEQTCISDDCGIIGGPCYYDGSTLGAEEPFHVLIREGTDGLWKYLEDYYLKTFDECERSD